MSTEPVIVGGELRSPASSPPPAPPCDACIDGVLINYSYGFVTFPAGTVPVQRCDRCARYRCDEAAAVALAATWGTDWGIAGDPDSDTEPGDWWVTLPTGVPEDPFTSESAAVQAWIDGVHIACLGCGEALGRQELAWHHLTEPAPRRCHSPQPAIADLIDAEAPDQIDALLRTPEWRGADFLAAINGIVIRTGRPAGLATVPDTEDTE